MWPQILSNLFWRSSKTGKRVNLPSYKGQRMLLSFFAKYLYKGTSYWSTKQILKWRWVLHWNKNDTCISISSDKWCSNRSLGFWNFRSYACRVTTYHGLIRRYIHRKIKMKLEEHYVFLFRCGIRNIRFTTYRTVSEENKSKFCNEDFKHCPKVTFRHRTSSAQLIFSVRDGYHLYESKRRIARYKHICMDFCTYVYIIYLYVCM